jgi:alkylhydroperoxidase/carboxymuconolactone decarboxylase family protein YurZ
MLVALNRPEELRLHLTAAVNHGVTPAQIKEVLLQAAVYCGLPAANAAFQLLAEVLTEAQPPASQNSTNMPRRE